MPPHFITFLSIDLSDVLLRGGCQSHPFAYKLKCHIAGLVEKNNDGTSTSGLSPSNLIQLQGKRAITHSHHEHACLMMVHDSALNHWTQTSYII